MTTDVRIDSIEKHLHVLQAVQTDLDLQLRQADEKVRATWDRTRTQAEDASSTAATVAETMRAGVQSAYAEVRDALHESRTKISG